MFRQEGRVQLLGSLATKQLRRLAINNCSDGGRNVGGLSLQRPMKTHNARVQARIVGVDQARPLDGLQLQQEATASRIDFKGEQMCADVVFGKLLQRSQKFGGPFERIIGTRQLVGYEFVQLRCLWIAFAVVRLLGFVMLLFFYGGLGSE